MANEVYANMMEVACKAAAGKSICAFPDVCFTPPLTPATPPGVPIPYPNTGMASDTTSGSSTVKISGQEVMLKDKSYFKTSTGDEAGSAPKKGVMTSKIKGKVFFNMWSMDVKVEGENVVRNLDMTTHNHASFVGNSPAWPYVDAVAMAKGNECHEDVEREKKACADCPPHKKGGRDPCDALSRKTKPPIKGVSSAKAAPIADQMSDEAAMDDCLSARQCLLQPYSRKTDDDGNKAVGCCKPQTGHHLIEKASFFDGGEQLDTFPPKGKKKYEAYDEAMAPCVCAEGTSHNRGGTHELMHAHQKAAAEACPKGKLSVGGKTQEFPHVTTYGEAKASAVEAHSQVFAGAECNPDCIAKQLDAYHNQCGITDSTKMKAVSEGVYPRMSVTEAEEISAERASKVFGERTARGVTIE